MKLDSEGKAFFVTSTTEEVKDQGLVTSPIPSDHDGDKNNNQMLLPSPKQITDKSANSNVADESEADKNQT
jgi:phosphatidate phosphatase PAH1